MCLVLGDIGVAHGAEPKPSTKPAPEPYLGPPRVPGQPVLSAAAAILLDGDTGQVLWSWNPDQRMYPASLTKMMSGLLAVEHGDLERRVRASKLAADTGESSIALTTGETLVLRQVLQASLIKSANDATVMLAEAVGGSVDQFVAQMNMRAATLGMTGTHFTNPHGLHHPEHYSTARDLGFLAWECMRHPDFSQIVGLHQADIPWPGKPWQRRLLNRNRLLRRWSVCDGIKTGYTRQAGRCLAASATENDWRLITVVLKCKDSWQDAQSLLEWGFRHFRHVRLIQAGTPDYRVPVQWGRRETVIARAERDLIATYPADQPLPELHQDTTPVQAPVVMGAPVGAIWYEQAGERHEVRLLACEDMPRSLWGSLAAAWLPQLGLVTLVALAVGVLLHGAGAKTARTRRRRLAAREREANTSGTSNSGRRTS